MKKFEIKCTRCESTNVRVTWWHGEIGYQIECSDCGNKTSDFHNDTIKTKGREYNY